MSRLSAGIIGGVTATMGAILGAGVSLQIAGSGIPGGPMTPREKVEAAKGAAIGGLMGAVVGAALGAGSDAPKQVGTSGVGELRSEWKL